MISILVVTHNRLELLRKCVENVLMRTSAATEQIVIWDNASSDGTKAYLESLAADPRVSIVLHGENIAMNARAGGFRLLTAPYLVELDDDIVEAPEEWDRTLLDAYRQLPKIGVLAANLRYDPNDVASRYLRYIREEQDAHPLQVVEGIRLLIGSPGGACTMISRELYERAGGYRESRRHPYWRPEIPLHRAVRRLGFETAFLADLEVWHAGGPHYSQPTREKYVYHAHEHRTRARKDAVKRLLLAIPGAAKLNRRYGWFDPPREQYHPALHDRPAE